ncbi:MAG: cysteine hydrolase family protein [Candidatus Binataceae bacterium]
MPINGVKPREQRTNPFEQTIIWDIVPEKTALVVIDMQNAFVNPKGLFHVPSAKNLFPKINNVAKLCRERGILVSWVVRHAYRRDGLDIGFERDFYPIMVGHPAAYTEDGWGVQLCPELDIDNEKDLIVPKTRFSALIPGSSNLDRILRYHGRDTIIVMGVATNICCGTTARDAMMLDYKVIFVSDGNEAFDESVMGKPAPSIIQEAELLTLRACFAEVCTTDELIGQIKGSPEAS